MPDGPARIVAVADTHSRPHPRALERIAAEQPAAVLHAGDIGDLGVLDALAELGVEVIAVRGNIDTRAPAVPDAITLAVDRGGREVLRLLLLHIAVYGPRLRREVRALAASEQVDLVVCGHSHVPLLVRDGDLAVFNPGSIGPRRFRLPIALGVLELGERGLSLRHVDVETGERWLPS